MTLLIYSVISSFLLVLISLTHIGISGSVLAVFCVRELYVSASKQHEVN